MKTNKGISLIVLVITIIVMIILAGAIILSLNNAGIINKANEAVDATNEATIRQLVELKWAEAYLDENVAKTDAGMYNAVMEKLEEENIDLTPYDIQVTAKGTTVEKIPTVQELQSTYEFKYYSSLGTAIADVNAGTIGTNADATKSNAKAGIYTTQTVDIDGNIKESINVVLLADSIEASSLKISKDVTINLGGNTVTFTGAMGISGVKVQNEQDEVDTIVIDGRLPGSTIIVNGSSAGTRAIQTLTSTVIINGGTYIANTVEDAGESTSFSAVVAHCNTDGNLQINNAEITVNMLMKTAAQNIKDGTSVYVMCVLAYGDSKINNCVLNTYATNIPEDVLYGRTMINGIEVSGGKLTLNNNKINVKSKANVTSDEQIYVIGIHARSQTEMTDCEINVENTENTANTSVLTRGIINTSTCILKTTEIYVSAETQGIGIYNFAESNITLTDCDITGVDTEIENYGKVYIDGVEYTQ